MAHFGLHDAPMMIGFSGELTTIDAYAGRMTARDITTHARHAVSVMTLYAEMAGFGSLLLSSIKTLAAE